LKKYFRIIGCGIIAGFFLIACAQTPVPISHVTSDQKKMQSAHHWAVLAGDVADQLQRKIEDAGFEGRPVYVTPAEGTTFNQGFQDFLITGMVNRGLYVVRNPAVEALTVTYDTQVVYHREKRHSRPHPGVLTATAALLTTGVWVIRDAFVYGSSYAQELTLGATALAAAAVADLAFGALPEKVPHSEVIITTSILDGDAYFMRKTDVYYVNDEDQWHYQPALTGKTIQVTGEKK
jgi:hypothetical protein